MPVLHTKEEFVNWNSETRKSCLKYKQKNVLKRAENFRCSKPTPSL
jgi:hypothetical protein